MADQRHRRRTLRSRAPGRALSRRASARLIAAVALLASGLFFVWHAALLPFGRVGLPGPGFFPFALGIALGLLALAILVRSSGASRATGERRLPRPPRRADRARCAGRRRLRVRARSAPTSTLGAVHGRPAAARCRACRSGASRWGRSWAWSRSGPSSGSAGRSAPDRRVLGCSEILTPPIRTVVDRMSAFDHLMSGFAVALSWKSLFYCFIGCLWGTIVGVLPGLGPLAGMALLLPLTFGLDPATGIIMLTGIFYGAMYGGSTTSILVRIPGEAASVVTCIDGYEMARQGRAGPALMIAAVGSFIGGTVSVLGLMLVAPPLARVMVAIGPSVEVVLMLLALVRHRLRLRRIAPQDGGHDRARARGRHRRPRQAHRRAALHLRQPGAGRRAVVHGARHRPVRHLRDPPQPGEERGHQGHPAEAQGPHAALERPEGSRRRRSAAAPSSASSSASFRASATWSRRSSPTPSRSASPSIPSSSARAPSPAWPGPRPPTTPPPAPP